MSVLLAEPRCPTRYARNPADFIGAANRSVNLSAPLGLSYLAAFLKASRIEPFGTDLNLCPDPAIEIIKKIKEIQPKIIGLAANFTVCINQTLVLARIIKKNFPNIIVVAGGNHATFRPAELLAGGIDVVVLNEGEITFTELVKTRLENPAADLAGIKGLAYQKDGQLIITAPRPALENLDDLPFPRLEIFETEKYGAIKTYPLVTSRGCAFDCYFCAISVFCRQKIRRRSPENIRAEMSLALAAGYQNFNFSDDNFAFSRERVIQICRAIKDLGVFWNTNARVEMLDRQILEEMRAAGCRQIRIGVESGSDQVLPKIKQGLTRARILEFVKNARNSNIEVVAGFMFPHYLDTPTSADETGEFLREIGAAGATVNLFMTTPFPGTPLLETPEKFGVKIIEKNWDKYDVLTPVFETEHFTVDKIKEKYRQLENAVFDLTVDYIARVFAENPDLQKYQFNKETIRGWVGLVFGNK